MNNKIGSILNTVLKVGLILVIIMIGFVSLATAYIMFAPDDYPKPFHLSYIYPTPTPTLDPAIKTLTATPTPAPTRRVYKPGEGEMINMSTKIINLADPSSRKYIRLTIVLEFAPDAKTPEPEKKAPAESATSTAATPLQEYINARMPILDDTVITMLSTKTYEDLYTAEGKEQLRQELMKAIATRVPNYDLINVYFTEFVVQ